MKHPNEETGSTCPPPSQPFSIPENITHYDKRPTLANGKANPLISLPANSKTMKNPRAETLSALARKLIGKLQNGMPFQGEYDE